MRIQLVDVDSKIPNVALGKISAWHKAHGHTVTFRRLGLRIPRTGQTSQPTVAVDCTEFDQTYVSAILDIFPKRLEFQGEPIVGGTGFSLLTNLPDYIEGLRPDWSLWPENNRTYTYLSRGCPRRCRFCVIPRKEGSLRQVATPKDVIDRPEVIFLDNNFLALTNRDDILAELAEMRVRIRFVQGLDARLLTAETARLLRRTRYISEYTFAFDSVASERFVDRTLKWIDKPWGTMWFCYTKPGDHTLPYRLDYLQKRHALAYVMRDLCCNDSADAWYFSDLANWANSKLYFKHGVSFPDYVLRRAPNRAAAHIARFLGEITAYLGCAG